MAVPTSIVAPVKTNASQAAAFALGQRAAFTFAHERSGAVRMTAPQPVRMPLPLPPGLSPAGVPLVAPPSAQVPAVRHLATLPPGLHFPW